MDPTTSCYNGILQNWLGHSQKQEASTPLATIREGLPWERSPCPGLLRTLLMIAEKAELCGEEHVLPHKPAFWNEWSTLEPEPLMTALAEHRSGLAQTCVSLDCMKEVDQVPPLACCEGLAQALLEHNVPQAAADWLEECMAESARQPPTTGGALFNTILELRQALPVPLGERWLSYATWSLCSYPETAERWTANWQRACVYATSPAMVATQATCPETHLPMQVFQPLLRQARLCTHLSHRQAEEVLCALADLPTQVAQKVLEGLIDHLCVRDRARIARLCRNVLSDTSLSSLRDRLRPNAQPIYDSLCQRILASYCAQQPQPEEGSLLAEQLAYFSHALYIPELLEWIACLDSPSERELAYSNATIDLESLSLQVQAILIVQDTHPLDSVTQRSSAALDHIHALANRYITTQACCPAVSEVRRQLLSATLTHLTQQSHAVVAAAWLGSLLHSFADLALSEDLGLDSTEQLRLWITQEILTLCTVSCGRPSSAELLLTLLTNQELVCKSTLPAMPYEYRHFLESIQPFSLPAAPAILHKQIVQSIVALSHSSSQVRTLLEQHLAELAPLEEGSTWMRLWIALGSPELAKTESALK